MLRNYRPYRSNIFNLGPLRYYNPLQQHRSITPQTQRQQIKHRHVQQSNLTTPYHPVIRAQRKIPAGETGPLIKPCNNASQLAARCKTLKDPSVLDDVIVWRESFQRGAIQSQTYQRAHRGGERWSEGVDHRLHCASVCSDDQMSLRRIVPQRSTRYEFSRDPATPPSLRPRPPQSPFRRPTPSIFFYARQLSLFSISHILAFHFLTRETSIFFAVTLVYRRRNSKRHGEIRR